MKFVHKKIMVHLRPVEDFKDEDVAEEGVLDEVRVKSYVITVARRRHSVSDYQNPTHPSCQYCRHLTM